MTLLKTLIWVVGLAPIVWLGAGFYFDWLGANPIETVILVGGRWTLVFLLATLAVTPLRRISGWNSVIKTRRLLGLFAFFHAVVHFLAYVGLDQFFAFSYIIEDVVDRRYITAGFLSLLLMVPLAMTSTRDSIRRLGKRWTKLHRLIYPAGALGVLHFYWKVKADTFWPLAAALILVTLFAARSIKRPPGRKSRNAGGVERLRHAEQTHKAAHVSN